MPTKTLTKSKPVILTLPVDSIDSGWKVILFNCYCHTFSEVRLKVMQATRFGYEKCFDITSTAETSGSAVVCEGSKNDCEKVFRILNGAGISVTLTQ